MKLIMANMKTVVLLFLFGLINAQLRSKSKQIYVGSTIDPDWITKDAQYKSLAAEQFNCLTPGNTMKWDAIEWTKGQLNFKSADELVKFAQEHQMKVRGHTLVWYNQLPPWVKNLENNKTELHSAMEKHIREEVGYYKGKIYAWDVVNEAFGDDGKLRDSLWTKNFGDTYIADAFKIAHSVDPNAKHYINDYNIEGKGAKSDSLYELVKKLKGEGVPIDGVGFQAHFIVGGVPGDLQSNLQRFADLGVDVAITELDVRIKLPVTSALLEQQAKDYAHVFSACEAVHRCVGITVWGFTDKDSWIPPTFPGYGSATLWDEQYKPKPAVSAIEKVLK